MSRQVIKKPQANEDLTDIFEYIGQDSPHAADRFLVAADLTFAKLARVPGLGQRWPSPIPQLVDVRVWPLRGFRNFLIFYRPTGDGIEVLHVIHASRDIPRILEAREAKEGEQE